MVAFPGALEGQTVTIKLFPAPPPIRGDAATLQLHERSRFCAAALHARRIYPGPLGELVSRELSAYAEFGYRLSSDGLIPRLASAVLATRADGGALGSTLTEQQHGREPDDAEHDGLHVGIAGARR
jgi:hypothetical protein